MVSSSAPRRELGVRPLSFNPLHCGAVVASRLVEPAVRSLNVSIPFIAGQWSLPRRAPSSRKSARRVSIPFIAGQWSLLPLRPFLRLYARRFNPLHCGAVVASQARAAKEVEARKFQSPSLRGSGRFCRRRAGFRGKERARVSIPFIAGQWSLLPQILQVLPISSPCFNPLHCGAVVASPSHNALPSLRRPAAEFATCLRPPSLGVLAQVA